jgi:putative ABC transport system permease protein
MGDLGKDIKHALQMFIKSPGFTCAAVSALALGLARIGAAFGLTRLIASFLFGVKSWDPLVFISVPVILSAVALLAVWLPAARAAKMDPMRALRVE